MFTINEQNRYSRNMLIEGFGENGQQALKRAKTLVIGAGGLGSPVLYYLAAAGMGTLGIMDFDKVDESNLQRQIIHNEANLGENKAISAKNKINSLNNQCVVTAIKEKFSEENASRIISSYDFIVDCCDNYETKYLIDEVCVQQHKPYCHGAVLSMQGEVMTYTPGHTRYKDIFGGPPQPGTIPTSNQIGILGAIAGVIGSIQATEVIKYFTKTGELIIDKILLFDGLTMTFKCLNCKK